MPRTSIPVQENPAHGGDIDQISWTAADQANGMEFKNDGRTILLMKNGDASPHTATIDSIACSHGRVGDGAIVVPAGEEGLGGPYPPAEFDQSGGVVHVDFDDDTSVEVAAVRMLGATGR